MRRKTDTHTICYLCNILDEKSKAERAIVFDSPAATKKVLDVCHALQNKFSKVYIVTMARGKQQSEPKTHPANVKKTAKIPILFAYFNPLQPWTYIITAISVFLLIWRILRQSKSNKLHLIVYNRNWLYVPALILVRLFGSYCYLDLEDGELIKTSNFPKRIIYKTIRIVFDLLCSHGSVLVTPGLINQVKTSNNVICYGVAQKNETNITSDWTKESVIFLLGGTLIKETGVQLLIDAVKILNRDFQTLKGQLLIYVTGQGYLTDELYKLSQQEGKNWLDFKGRVSKSEYEVLLNKSHVGLCLKLPSSEMGATTFPSKVIEIAAQGKLVLTTNLGQVNNLLGSDGAVFLENENPTSLVNAMIDIINDRTKYMEATAIGQQRVFNMCSSEKVASSFEQLFANH